jgi:8-oxo-dGTP pyrophosphatase MutT (NUDIX family)
MDDGNVSLAILKPDFKALDLLPELEVLMTQNGLRIIASAEIRMDLAFVKLLYQWGEVNYPREIEAYLCLEPMTILIVCGKNAIMKMLDIKMGIRKRHSQDRLHTVIHCPDTANDFHREFNLLNQRIGGVMKTNSQVEVIVFRKTTMGIGYLMLKRNEKKGGFWQPITGNVEFEETFLDAAYRELYEETGIVNPIRIFHTGHSFDFVDDNRKQHEEVFAAEVPPETAPTLSAEHTEMRWGSEDDCLTKYLKYPGNIAGLKALARVLEAEGGEHH